jgi:hypothetical protein
MTQEVNNNGTRLEKTLLAIQAATKRLNYFDQFGMVTFSSKTWAFGDTLL